ncbi:hypothetical protein [Methylobacterium sp. JK268]
MNAIRAIARELVGLVVDDVGFAAAAVGWIALVWLLSAAALLPSSWLAVTLFGGLGTILLESVLRRSGDAR